MILIITDQTRRDIQSLAGAYVGNGAKLLLAYIEAIIYYHDRIIAVVFNGTQNLPPRLMEGQHRESLLTLIKDNTLNRKMICVRTADLAEHEMIHVFDMISSDFGVAIKMATDEKLKDLLRFVGNNIPMFGDCINGDLDTNQQKVNFNVVLKGNVHVTLRLSLVKYRNQWILKYNPHNGDVAY